jgi:hypothetical protein
MKPGETWLIFVPPSWLLAGTIDRVEDDEIVFSDSVYLQSVASGHCSFTELPSARTRAEIEKIVSSSWPIRPGMRVRREGILIAVPCATDLSCLTRADVARVIGGVR